MDSYKYYIQPWPVPMVYRKGIFKVKRILKLAKIEIFKLKHLVVSEHKTLYKHRTYALKY